MPGEAIVSQSVLLKAAHVFHNRISILIGDINVLPLDIISPILKLTIWVARKILAVDIDILEFVCIVIRKGLIRPLSH